MSLKAANNLTRDQLKRILSMAKADSQVQEPDVEFIDYDWKRPHQLTPMRKCILEQFAKKLKGDLTENMASIFNSELKVKIPFIHEHYSDVLREGIGETAGNYYMTFRDNTDEIAGIIVITKIPAVQLAAKILGDPTPEALEDYELSNLEESLLADMCNELISTVSKCFQAHEMTALGDNSPLTNREWPVECPGYESLSEIPLRIEHGDEYIEISMIVMTNLFAPLLQVKFPKEGSGDLNENRKKVIENLNEISVDINVLLGNARVSMADLMDIEKGDVIMLDRKSFEPLEVRIENKTYFMAYPAKSMNRYALSLKETIKPY